MKCFTDFIENRVYVDTYFLRLHRRGTLIVLLIAFIVTTADLLISENTFCYDFTKKNHFLCDAHILENKVNPLLYIFEAIVAYLPFCIFSIGADKHPFKVLEEIQLISSDKSASEQLATVMGRLDDFLASYRQTGQKKKRHYRTVCLLLQESFQLACFAVNFYLIHYILSYRLNRAPENILSICVLLAVWFWYFVVGIISATESVSSLSTFLIHKNKTFNGALWEINDDVVLDKIGRLNYADWLFFDYVRNTTLHNFFKSALMRLDDEVGNDDLSLEV